LSERLEHYKKTSPYIRCQKSQWVDMHCIATEFVFTIRVTLADMMVIGEMPRGLRRFVPIAGGTISGPAFSGSVLPLGGDTQIAISGTLLEVDARYFIRTHDEVTIAVINRGMRRAPASVMARLGKGEAVNSDEYYFRTAPCFEAPRDSAYRWMNESIFVATAQREKNAALIHVHRVL
jgi:hypothetical protein